MRVDAVAARPATDDLSSGSGKQRAPSAEALSPAQREFAELLGRLLAARWAEENRPLDDRRDVGPLSEEHGSSSSQQIGESPKLR
jgi:hypothetical protein